MPDAPRQSVAFDRVAARYDETRGGRRRGENTVTGIESWLRPGPVLEVGVGTGIVAAALRGRGYPVVGIDLAPAMLEVAARRLGPGLVALGDARALPVASGSVSTVVFVYALHVIGDTIAALAEAARVLRPAGRVIAIHSGATDDVTDMTAAMAPVQSLSRNRVDLGDAVGEAGVAAGLAILWHGRTDANNVRHSPRQLADGLRERLWSYLWDVDDDAWRRHVVPAIDALEALPEPDRAREYGQRHLLTVLAKP